MYRLLNNLDLKFDLVGNRSVDIFSIYANYVSHEIDFPVVFYFIFKLTALLSDLAFMFGDISGIKIEKCLYKKYYLI